MNPVEYEARADAAVKKWADGCCGNDEWRGHFCQYHQGMQDGLDMGWGIYEDLADADPAS